MRRKGMMHPAADRAVMETPLKTQKGTQPDVIHKKRHEKGMIPPCH